MTNFPKIFSGNNPSRGKHAGNPNLIFSKRENASLFREDLCIEAKVVGPGMYGNMMAKIIIFISIIYNIHTQRLHNNRLTRTASASCLQPSNNCQVG
jgi:hypothetical protein